MIKYFKFLAISLMINGCATAELTYMSGLNLHERDSYNYIMQTLGKNNFKIISDTLLSPEVKEDDGVRGVIAEGPPTKSGMCTRLSIVIYPDTHKDKGLQFMNSVQVKCQE